ncbi:MAG: thiamine pyrophosphate-binding protein, partial [Selenomonadaceae bacterium]|nr:thiamine pyrophosphate-binding protein [Selenomonadaceae bacterium]
THGRPGPVWLDVPINVQSATVETDELKPFEPSREMLAVEQPAFDEIITQTIIDRISRSKRPVIYAGNGIRLSGAYDQFLELIERLKIPVVTSWDAHDLMWNAHECYAGRPGTVGTRGGNFVVETGDLLIILGSRMNIRQISYNYENFARGSYKIMVDIDEGELRKPTLKIDYPICADVRDVINSLLKVEYEPTAEKLDWLRRAHEMGDKYPAAREEYYRRSTPLNPYAFMEKFFGRLSDDEVVVCGNGSASVIPMQAGTFKRGQRVIANSGCAAMGYGFPASIGCSIAQRDRRVICIDGDGSFQMNIQELQTVVYNRLDLKIVYINNNGYHSIRQTQTNLFEPPLVGVCDGNGLSFPDIEKIAAAYGITFFRIDDLNRADELIDQFLSTEGAALCEIVVDVKQNFEPKLSSKRLPDGRIVSPPLDDMFPFLPRDEYERNKNF